MKYRNGYKRRRFLWRMLFFLWVVLLAVCLLAAQMRPIILEYASNLVQYTATEAINDAVQDKIYQNRAQYESLVSFEHDNTQRVTALKTDTITINRMKTEIVSMVYDRINALEQTTLSVPLGSIFLPAFSGGKGPKLQVGMAGLGFAKAEFASAFSQAGINQTRHNIVLEVHAEVSVLTLFGSQVTEINSSFYVTDTIIVGTVPEQYTYIDDTEQSLLGKINDYAE